MRPPADDDDEVVFLPALRLGFGPSFHLAPTASQGTGFAFDATAGGAAWIHLKKKYGLVVGGEAGYARDDGYNAFDLALDLGIGHPLAYVAYHPHFLAGSEGGNTMLGVRNGIAMHLLWDMGSFEIAHETTHAGDDWHQSLKLMFAVNPAAFVYKLMTL